MGQDDLNALCRGLHNGQAGRLALDGLPPFADSVQRALCLAGFELARTGRRIGRLPVLLHSGRNGRFWLVGNEATNHGNYRPVFNATPANGGQPEGESGYRDLRALFRLKGEPQAR